METLNNKLKKTIYNSDKFQYIDSDEYLLNPENNRLTIFPIENKLIWESYKKQQAAIWFAEEIDFSKDYEDFIKLNNDEQYFIKMILGFFSISDTIININLSERFLNEIKIREALTVYTWQMAMESIHCCSGNTKILLKQGYYELKSLINTKVEVWNGKFFSNTIVRYTGNSILYNVELSNGMTLECTPMHKWFINKESNKYICYTNQLNVGDIIYNYDLPIINFNNENNYSISYIKELFDNFIVPINYSINVRLIWFNFLLKQHNVIKYYYYIHIYNNNLKFLKDIQLLLTTLSINATITNNTLILSLEENNILIDLCKKYNIIEEYNISEEYNIKKECNIKKQITIVKITLLEGIHKTYCFTEKYEHSGIFNGILTGQSETYSLQIDNIIKDPIEKDKVFNAIENLSCIVDKIAWTVKWIESKASFQTRLIAFVIVEGIFFSGSFCAIFWLKKRNIMPGLCSSNELISRDESQHCNFAVLLYSMIKNKLTEKQIHEMFKEAVYIECKFICDCLPCALIGMNSNLMTNYIKYVADRLLIELNYSKIFNVTNPFDFMESISIEGKTNFFENRPTQYQKSSILNTSKEVSFNNNSDNF